MPPIEPIVQAADLLDKTVQRFLDARRTIPAMGRFEVHDECHSMLKLVVRHVEAVSELARRDLVLLAPAITLSRSAFEVALQVLWLLDPDDPFKCELRWLAYLKEGEEHYRSLARRLADAGGDGTSNLQFAATIGRLRSEIEAKLPRNLKPLPKMPNLFDMLKQIKEERKYLTYMVASQYSHGTWVSGGLYRRHFGTAKQFGEFISPQDWGLPLLLCWFALHAAGQRFFMRVGGDVSAFLPRDFALSVQRAIDEVGNEVPP